MEGRLESEENIAAQAQEQNDVEVKRRLESEEKISAQAQEQSVVGTIVHQEHLR